MPRIRYEGYEFPNVFSPYTFRTTPTELTIQFYSLIMADSASELVSSEESLLEACAKIKGTLSIDFSGTREFSLSNNTNGFVARITAIKATLPELCTETTRPFFITISMMLPYTQDDGRIEASWTANVNERGILNVSFDILFSASQNQTSYEVALSKAPSWVHSILTSFFPQYVFNVVNETYTNDQYLKRTKYSATFTQLARQWIVKKMTSGQLLVDFLFIFANENNKTSYQVSLEKAEPYIDTVLSTYFPTLKFEMMSENRDNNQFMKFTYYTASYKEVLQETGDSVADSNFQDVQITYSLDFKNNPSNLLFTDERASSMVYVNCQASAKILKTISQNSVQIIQEVYKQYIIQKMLDVLAIGKFIENTALANPIVISDVVSFNPFSMEISGRIQFRVLDYAYKLLAAAETITYLDDNGIIPQKLWDGVDSTYHLAYTGKKKYLTRTTTISYTEDNVGEIPTLPEDFGLPAGVYRWVKLRNELRTWRERLGNTKLYPTTKEVYVNFKTQTEMFILVRIAESKTTIIERL